MNHQESFINYIRYEKRYSSHTVVAYKNDLDQFVSYYTDMIGEFNIKGVNSRHIRGWIVFLMEQKLSARTVNRKITTLKAFFKYLRKEEIIEKNPAVNLPQPKNKRKLPFFVEESKLIHLLDDGYFESDFSGVRDKLIISFFYGTGIRLAELLNLKDTDVDTNECLIKVLGKRNKERIIPYPVSINKLIFDYIYIRNMEIGNMPNHLFVTEKGKPVYDKLVYRIVKGYLSKVTSLEKRSPHVLRHTYATHLLNNGADLNALKELLGHSNLAATQVYTHTTFEKLHEIYKQAHPRG